MKGESGKGELRCRGPTARYKTICADKLRPVISLARGLILLQAQYQWTCIRWMLKQWGVPLPFHLAQQVYACVAIRQAFAVFPSRLLDLIAAIPPQSNCSR